MFALVFPRAIKYSPTQNRILLRMRDPIWISIRHRTSLWIALTIYKQINRLQKMRCALMLCISTICASICKSVRNLRVME